MYIWRTECIVWILVLSLLLAWISFLLNDFVVVLVCDFIMDWKLDECIEPTCHCGSEVPSSRVAHLVEFARLFSAVWPVAFMSCVCLVLAQSVQGDCLFWRPEKCRNWAISKKWSYVSFMEICFPWKVIYENEIRMWNLVLAANLSDCVGFSASISAGQWVC